MKLLRRYLGLVTLVISASLPFVAAVFPICVFAQEPASPAKPALDKVLGTVTAVTPGEKSFTIKEDKTGTEYAVSGANARKFLKVPPGEKDIKKAQPIDPGQIAIGDRLVAYGRKDAALPKLEAAIVVVMTAGELQQKHASEIAEWQKRGSRGTASEVNQDAHQITMTARTPEGSQTIVVTTTPDTQFSRYAADSVNYADATPSSLAEVRPGDQLRILGNKNEDGSKISADKIIFGSFRTVGAKVVSIAADGKQIEATDLQTKQPVTIVLTAKSSIRKLPPEMASALAGRQGQENPAGRSGGPGTQNGSNAQEKRAQPASTSGNQDEAGAGRATGSSATGEGGGRPRGAGGRDISQMVERLPQISISDLKPGDELIISGGAGEDHSKLTAVNVIAGAEPLFASAPARNGRSSNALSGWNLDVGGPTE